MPALKPSAPVPGDSPRRGEAGDRPPPRVRVPHDPGSPAKPLPGEPSRDAEPRVDGAVVPGGPRVKALCDREADAGRCVGDAWHERGKEGQCPTSPGRYCIVAGRPCSTSTPGAAATVSTPITGFVSRRRTRRKGRGALRAPGVSSRCWPAGVVVEGDLVQRGQDAVESCRAVAHLKVSYGRKDREPPCAPVSSTVVRVSSAMRIGPENHSRNGDGPMAPVRTESLAGRTRGSRAEGGVRARSRARGSSTPCLWRVVRRGRVERYPSPRGDPLAQDGSRTARCLVRLQRRSPAGKGHAEDGGERDWHEPRSALPGALQAPEQGNSGVDSEHALADVR